MSNFNDLEERLLNIKDSTEVKVRFNDTDAMGVVHFMNYLMYFDDGFVSFMDRVIFSAPLGDIVHKGILFPVKKIDIVYEDSARFGDYVIVETCIKKLGNKSIHFYHEIFRKSDNRLLAKVNSVRLIMNNETKSLLDVREFFAGCV